MFLTTWAAIFVAFGLLFTVIFSGSRFKAQPGESLIKSFFLTFYKDKPGRFVLTNRRIVFVPEAFSTWFGSTRVSMELDQIAEVEAHSTISGGRLSILSSNGSVHQFSMPNLVLEPLAKQLKALAASHSQIESGATTASSSNTSSTTASSTTASSIDTNADQQLLDSPISFSPFADEVDDKDAVIITIVAHDPDVSKQTTDDSKDQSAAPVVDV
jgi:hypothetical protein